MRISERVKRSSGGTHAHDRVCLYIRDRAAQFIDSVRPSRTGYEHVSVELEHPFTLYDGEIAGYADLAIRAYERPPTEADNGMRRAWWHVFFIEVKPTHEDSLGATLRQIKRYQHLVAAEQMRKEVERFKRQAFYEVDDDVSHWVLATIYKPTVDERVILNDTGIIVRTLNAERVTAFVNAPSKPKR